MMRQLEMYQDLNKSGSSLDFVQIKDRREETI